MDGAQPNYFTFNGKAYPTTPTYPLRLSQRQLTLCMSWPVMVRHLTLRLASWRTRSTLGPKREAYQGGGWCECGGSRHQGTERMQMRLPSWPDVAHSPRAKRSDPIRLRQLTVEPVSARPPSQGWKTFLRNHADAIAAVDFLVVPTLSFERLFAFVILGVSRRNILWIGVTTNPTAQWLAHQITEAFPWDTAPTFLIRDNDCAYGEAFTRRVRSMGIRDRPIAPRSPWQNGYVERAIGSIRRECLDHMIVWSEAHLRRVLKEYTFYYNAARTHLGLQKDAPHRRPIERRGRIVTSDVLGGLHHQYCRI
jgi:transposase InsO family protein